ncbi:hypothetical protein [Pseudomonas sp. 22 E 5]|nr:hypothetical protein [Pseudomonas sp. 22 E 5]
MNALTGCISVAAVTATYGSALTAGHFWKGPKVTKRPSPHHSAPRLGSVCPHSGLNPWAAAMGHPWPSAANPASCRVTHGFKPAFGQRGFTGRRRSKAKAKAARFASWVRGPVGAGLPAKNVRPPRFVWFPLVIVEDLRRQAGSYTTAFALAFAPHHSSRLSGRCALAFDFDLRRPPNHCRITGTPSLGEVPSVGARAFCLLLRFSKVSRRKGGTNSRRYPKNGYVHLKTGPTQ